MTAEEVRRYTREEFLDEFFPDADDRAAIAAGMEQLRAGQHAYRSPRCAAAWDQPGPGSRPDARQFARAQFFHIGGT